LVNLKRRGTSYIGLCPFHNERTPSFSVSKARGYCKCFSCGKGGSAVGFIMEHEQLSYGEALRWLANKYHIEIQEEELTPEQLAAASERESMLALNDFALTHFEHNMTETDDGRAIGLAYFRERGLTDAAIKRFRLGYALDRHNALSSAALGKGYSEELLLKTGLCGKSDHGGLYDRFRGRVIYPVFALSGKVLAFGGRTLRKEKDVAKYVNSPESSIYNKSSQLYGLYQARRAIVAANKCILVEGYMDVISMSQRGVENIVASSGTSLTEGQIALIHRFTDNVTVIYDADAAGIKASLRGIDMLLAEGLNIRVMLLPPGEDPDSFAQAHTLEEIQAYMQEHETDFIRFKTQVLLKDVAANDPLARASVISNIARSISVIPDVVVRSEYVKECSRLLSTSEEIVSLQVAKYSNEAADKRNIQQRQQQNAAAIDETAAKVVSTPTVPQRADVATGTIAGYMRPYELEVLRLVVRYGMMTLCKAISEDGSETDVSVLQYVDSEMTNDDMKFANDDIATTYEAIRVNSIGWHEARARHSEEMQTEAAKLTEEGRAEIRANAKSTIEAERMEKELNERVEHAILEKMNDYAERFLTDILASDPNSTIRTMVTTLISDKYVLSKIHTKHSHVEAERDCLPDRVPKAVFAWKNAVLECREKALRKEMAEAVAAADNDRVMELLQKQKELRELMAEIAKYLGERIITPRK
jgi:DNA primase